MVSDFDIDSRVPEELQGVEGVDPGVVCLRSECVAGRVELQMAIATIERLEREALIRLKTIKVQARKLCRYQLVMKEAGVRAAYALLRAHHHLVHARRGTRAEVVPRGLVRAKTYLSGVISPAAPNDETAVKVEGNACNWLYTSLQLLEEHYEGVIERAMVAVGQIDAEGPIDHQQTWEVALRWMASKYRASGREATDRALRRAGWDVSGEAAIQSGHTAEGKEPGRRASTAETGSRRSGARGLASRTETPRRGKSPARRTATTEAVPGQSERRERPEGLPRRLVIGFQEGGAPADLTPSFSFSLVGGGGWTSLVLIILCFITFTIPPFDLQGWAAEGSSTGLEGAAGGPSGREIQMG
ncbi:hypothetical protein EYF80_014548 [Liparis tanakae]|uniref:Uncharacterized protein n=1 Tax=Liparis tanakae TaxID=230148 RepID=A0A4Z2IAV8_9TELE|nr:hypothetical protein EYF80_014548 [Liparis tanakae]